MTKITKPSQTEMQAADVVNFIQLCEQNDIEVYVDGGWGVDALLGKQTRTHGDLDIALPHKFVPKLRKLLETRGYKDVERDDTRDCNFVLGDNSGHLIDIHLMKRATIYLVLHTSQDILLGQVRLMGTL